MEVAEEDRQTQTCARKKNSVKNEADTGRMETAENGGRETAASRARVGSLHNPSSGIRLPLLPSCLCSEVEEQEVTVLASDLEVA